MTSPTTPGFTGYRNLTDEDKAAINAVKEMENLIGALVHNLVEQIPELDRRLAGMAISELQVGFMLLVRSIAQPQSMLAPISR